MFAAVLDTCVLWPNRLRDFLLSLAAEGLYRPLWSSRILEELAYETVAKLCDEGRDEVDARSLTARLIRKMNSAFDDALVPDIWQYLDGTFGLPDPNDEHVLAAAVIGGAGAVVTHNVTDFPTRLVPVGIDILTPAEFGRNTVDLNPSLGWQAVQEMAARSGRAGPRRTPDDVLDLLANRYGLTAAVSTIRERGRA